MIINRTPIMISSCFPKQLINAKPLTEDIINERIALFGTNKTSRGITLEPNDVLLSCFIVTIEKGDEKNIPTINFELKTIVFNKEIEDLTENYLFIGLKNQIPLFILKKSNFTDEELAFLILQGFSLKEENI
jgi:hypothetical protein